MISYVSEYVNQLKVNHLTSRRWPFTRNVIPYDSNGYDRALASN